MCLGGKEEERERAGVCVLFNCECGDKQGGVAARFVTKREASRQFDFLLSHEALTGTELFLICHLSIIIIGIKEGKAKDDEHQKTYR